MPEASQPARFGPAPRYQAHHSIKALFILRKEGKMGRKRLAKIIDVGEGSCRSIIENLRESGLIDVHQTGISANERGLARIANFSGPEIISAGDLTIDNHDIAIQIKGAAGSITDGMRQRDAAIMLGASGATTILATATGLFLPGPEPHSVEIKYPDVAEKIGNIYNVEPGDVIIIATADSAGLALDAIASIALDFI